MFQSQDIRLLLTWGHDPLDLDSHVKFFDANGNEVCELNWQNKNCDDYVTLDVDETNVSIIETFQWKLLNGTHATIK